MIQNTHMCLQIQIQMRSPYSIKMDPKLKIYVIFLENYLWQCLILNTHYKLEENIIPIW